MPGRADRFSLVHSDAMLVTELPGPPPTALVANLPYNVAVPVLLHDAGALPDHRADPGHGAGRGRRPAGRPAGQQGLRRAVGEGQLVRGRQAGRVHRPQRSSGPRPNVDSGLVSLVRRTEPITTTASRAEVFAVVDAAFAQRRKTLRAALAGWAGSAPAAEAALVAAGISPQARGRGADGRGVRGASPRTSRRRTGEQSAWRDEPAGESTGTSPPGVASERHRSRPRQGQRAARGRRRRAPTASTTWPTSSSPSASTTRSPSPPPTR